MVKERLYECKFCHTSFVYEDRFLNHKCKQMQRHEEFQTPLGQAAWIYYQEWMKAYQRMVPRTSSFLQSKFYTSFIKFATFVKQVNMPDTKLFIRLMKQRDLSPTLWTNDAVYTLYLEVVDKQRTPLQHAKTSIDKLYEFADEYHCNISEVFDHIQPAQIIQSLRQRQLSPWILLCSKKFMLFFSNMSHEERIIIETIVRPTTWSQRFKDHPKEHQTMKRFVSELKI